MSAWTPAFDREARALVQRVLDGDRAAWRELMVRVAPRIEGWARASHVLRRCRLIGDDDARAVMVSVLERLAASEHANLRKFVARSELPAAPTDLVTDVLRLGRLVDDAEEADAETDAGTDTPLRAWLLRLVDYAARDHVRDRYGWAVGDGGPSKRDLHTDARPLADQPEPAARPQMTDKLTMSRLVEEIQEQIRAFPPQMRDAIQLWLDDVPVDEIASRLSLGDGGKARALIRAGQARLRDRFRGRSPLLFPLVMRALVIVAALALTPSLAAADDGVTWKATRGTVARGRLAGSYLLASDAAPGRYSVGELVSVEEVALPYRFTVTWRRLGVEAGRSMHVLVAGGVVLIKSGSINFYAYDDAAFASGDWQPIAGHAASDEHTVVVDQDAHAVMVSIDGSPAARYPLAVTRTTAHVGVGMKAAPGHRSKIYLRSLMVAQ